MCFLFHPIRRGLAPSFVNYKKGCTQLAAASDKVYQLLAHGQWFSPGTPAYSTTKTGRHDIAEILLKVALNTINQSLQKISILICRVVTGDVYYDPAHDEVFSIQHYVMKYISDLWQVGGFLRVLRFLH